MTRYMSTRSRYFPRSTPARRAADADEKMLASIKTEPLLAWLTYIDNIQPYQGDFLRSVAQQFHRRGELSENQRAAVVRALNKSMARQASKDAERAEYADANTVPLTEDRVLMMLKVYGIYHKESDYYGAPQRTARCREVNGGYTIYMNIPSRYWDQVKVGDTMVVQARVARSKKDPKVGNAKRPTIESIIPADEY